MKPSKQRLAAAGAASFLFALAACSAADQASPPPDKKTSDSNAGAGGGAGSGNAGSGGAGTAGSGTGGSATGGNAGIGSSGTGGAGGGSQQGGGSGGSSAGSGGSGNAPTGATDLITDLESGPTFSSGGRSGSWYVYNDKTAAGMQTPTVGTDFKPDAVMPARSGSTFAAHTSGSGFTVWGAGMGFDVNNPGGTAKKVYDASAYSGITFWAKGTASKAVRMNIPTKDTSPEGNLCNMTDAGDSVCNDHFGTTLTLTADWTQQTVDFANDLAQSHFGPPADFKPSEIYGVQFQVGPGATFDFWIDDVAFVKK